MLEINNNYNNMRMLDKPNIALIGPEVLPRSALRLFAENPIHRNYAADLLIQGKIGAIGFNGIYGLFCSADDKFQQEKILIMKNRPNDKHGVLVVQPENLREYTDISKTNFTFGQIIKLQKHLHALGVILPASDGAPSHLVNERGKDKTILSIWTEYQPLRNLIEEFQGLGGRALAGTSANRSGQPTHFDTEAVWQDFKKDVGFVLEADYSALPPIRRQSTSVIDLTGEYPRLHRAGNVSKEEINAALKKFKFPALQEGKKDLPWDVQARLLFFGADIRAAARSGLNLKQPRPQS
jgi:tRNA A37 threonylcarbamoyladenosine synthetase subunit TsaC/SUA5/YrdC